MNKHKIEAVIINPQALEKASIRKTKILFEIWWEIQKEKHIDMMGDHE